MQRVTNNTINQPPQSTFFAGMQHSTYTGVLYLLNLYAPTIVPAFQHHYRDGATGVLPRGVVPLVELDSIPMMNAFWLSAFSILPSSQQAIRAKSALTFTTDLSSYLECFLAYVIPYIQQNVGRLFK